NVRRQAEPNRRRAAETMPALPRRGPRSRQSSRLPPAEASRRRQDSEGRSGQRLSCGHLHTGESSSYTTSGRAVNSTREQKVGQPDITEYESGAPTSASPCCEFRAFAGCLSSMRETRKAPRIGAFHWIY